MASCECSLPVQSVDSLSLVHRHHIDRAILDIAKILRAHPQAFHKLNGILHPYAHVELNVRRSPITSFVLKTPDSSRILSLSRHQDHLSLGSLSTTQLCEMFTRGRCGEHTNDDLFLATDSGLQECLAQLAQDVSFTSRLNSSSYLLFPAARRSSNSRARS